MKRALLVIAADAARRPASRRRLRPRSSPPRPASGSACGTASSSPSTFILSFFTDEVAVYAVPNNGTWYDFGYFVGIVFLGVGAARQEEGGR